MATRAERRARWMKQGDQLNQQIEEFIQTHYKQATDEEKRVIRELCLHFYASFERLPTIQEFTKIVAKLVEEREGVK